MTVSRRDQRRVGESGDRLGGHGTTTAGRGVGEVDDIVTTFVAVQNLDGSAPIERDRQMVDALASIESDGQVAGDSIATHLREIGDVAEDRPCLAHQDQAVDPSPDEEQVRLIDRLEVGSAEIRHTGDRARDLLQFGNRQLRRVPGEVALHGCLESHATRSGRA